MGEIINRIYSRVTLSFYMWVYSIHLSRMHICLSRFGRFGHLNKNRSFLFL